MKKFIIIFAVLFVYLFSIFLVSLKSTDFLSDNYTQNQIVTSENQQTDSIKFCNYNDLVFDTVKEHFDVNNCDISRVYMQKIPYYIIECKANNVVINDLEDFSLKVSESIYNDLLKYDFENISDNANEIISISYYIYENDKIRASYCVQFNMSEADRSKSFEENLKLHQMIQYSQVLF